MGGRQLPPLVGAAKDGQSAIWVLVSGAPVGGLAPMPIVIATDSGPSVVVSVATVQGLNPSAGVPTRTAPAMLGI